MPADLCRYLFNNPAHNRFELLKSILQRERNKVTSAYKAERTSKRNQFPNSESTYFTTGR
jgi:hypothetical protein